MKKLYFFLSSTILLVLLSYTSLSQPYGWFTQSSSTTNNLNALYFSNTTTGTVVGYAGTIKRTTNGGTNWYSQSSGTPNHLFGVYFINANTGWASGDVGVILKTTNGGSSWVIQYSNTIYQLHSISFINSSTGMIAGWYGTIVKTTNGGSSWLVLTSGIVTNLRGISFVNSSTGYSVGWLGTIIKTLNGGANWYAVSSGTANELEDVIFTDAYTGYITGEGGRIQKTTNGGANWIVQNSGTGGWLLGITNPAANMFITAGENGTLRKTSNGGLNWITQSSASGMWLNSISFPDTNTGYAAGDNGVIIKTTTGGWLPPQTPALNSPANNATCVSVTATLDWNDIIPPAPLYTVQVSTQSGFNTIVIDKDSLMTSAYAVQSGALSYNTLYYWRVKAKNQVAEGSWSSIRSFTTTFPSPAAPVLVSPPNNSTGITLTPILDWDSIPAASSYRVRLSADSTFGSSIIDTSGVVIARYNVPAGKLSNNIKYFWRVYGNNSCITGPSSQVWNFRTLITGVIVENNQLPKEFKLYNNYPNPFNPLTHIRFDVPSLEGGGGNVKLIIYDVLGKEVITLIDKNVEAGSYDIEWNAVNYPSGIYFYKINSGQFTDIKKMALIK
ncbi:MAG: T9SS C-terminal target domain-containing protein [Ignavibacteriae bacterium]|nr:MAG: T9SS C-terminal target domain-containing protein [Ignavibacteriota bacterium]